MKGKKGGNVTRQKKTEGEQSNSAGEDREVDAVGEDHFENATWTPGCLHFLTEREGNAGPWDPEVHPAARVHSSHCWLLSARLCSSTFSGTWILTVHNSH